MARRTAATRFYVLRDTLGAVARSTPLTESDLERLTPPQGVAADNAAGYYLALGSAQVVAQALTLDGRIHFTAVENGRILPTGCASSAPPAASVPLSVTVLQTVDGTVAPGDAGNGAENNLRRPLGAAFSASAAVMLAATPPPADGRLTCLIGTTELPGCFLDTHPHRSWWRREDAD